MAQCVFRTSSISGTNQDKSRGDTVTGSFYLYSGSLPPAGSSLQSVSVYFSNVVVYSTSAAGFSTSYGSFDLGLDSSGSQSCTMYGASSSLLNFTGGSITFTVTGGSSSSSNVLNVRSGSYIQITVNYVASSSSTGSLSSTSVYQGGSLTLSINPASSDFTHKVKWYRSSSYTTEYELAAGVTSTPFTVPSSWPTGSATVTLYSYYDGTLIGSNTYSFTISVNPSTVVPTAGTLAVSLVQSSYIPSGWGVYVKGYSKAKLTLSGMSAGSGASYKSIALACGSQSQSTTSTSTFTTAALQETGTIACTAKVTNSYGNAASATAKSIVVYDYYEPIFAVVSAFRCTANGTPSDTGAYFGVTASVNIASVNGKNSLISLQARYAVQGTTSWSTAVSITNGGTTIIGGGASGSSTYQVQVIAIDAVQNLRNTNSNVAVTALTSEHVIYCMDGGLNVSFGMEGTRQNAVEINPAWGIYHGDTRLDGTVAINRGGTGATTAAGARNALGLGNTTGALPIANGGTGATSAAAARNALGLGNTTGALPIANGGTGATSAAAARNALSITPANIGAAAASHGHSASEITSGTLAKGRLPFKFAYGSVTLSGVSWATVDFSSAGFTSTPAIVCTPANGASAINGSYDLSLKTANESSTGFEVCFCGNSGSGSRLVNWIALGT